MNVKSGLLYSKDHEWVQELGDVVRIGITDYAQDKLGDIVFIELPETEDEVVQGEALTVVESVKAASDIASPVTGRIVRVNALLEDDPELMNTSPYEEGWIVEIEPTDNKGFTNLMTAEEYEVYSKEG